MAGSAGTLEIELIADVARLKQDMRDMERTVKAANDNIERSTTRAGGAFGGFSKGAAGAGKSSQLAGHHMANLSFQLQDIAVSLQGGQKPLTVFMQQGGQIAQIMMMAGIGIGGLGRAIGTMILNFAKAHPVIAGVTVAAGALVAGMKLIGNQANETAALDKYARSLGLTDEEMKRLSSTSVTLGDSFSGLWQTILDSSSIDETIGEYWDLFKGYAGDALKWLWEATKSAVAGIYAGFAGSIKAVGILWQQLPGVAGEAMAGLANLALSVLEAMLNRWVQRMNTLIAAVNYISPFDDIAMIAEVSFGRIENKWAGSTARMGSELRGTYASAYKDAEAFIADFGTRLEANIVGASRARIRKEAEAILGDRTKSSGQKARELKDLEDATNKAKEAADDYLQSLIKENAQMGKNSIQLKQMEIDTAALAAEKAGLVEESKKIREEGAKLIEGMQRQAEVRYKEQIQSIKDELAIMHLVGPERAKAALALEEEAFKARAAADGIRDVEGAWQEYFSLRTQQIDLQTALDKDREAALRLDEALRGVLDTLGGIGGFGGVLGGLIEGLQTGNFNSAGPIGQLFTILTSPMGELDKTIDRMSKTLQDTFGLGGSFASTLSKGLMGAAIGSAAGSVVFGKNQSRGTSTGSQLGGALGGLLTSSSFGGALSFLGSAAGPVGAIVGSLLGGVLGGLLSKTQRASVNIGGSGSELTATARRGYNTRELLANSQQAAGGVISTVNDIAAALGGTINASAGRVSIGQRKGKWVVDVTGSGRTKGAGTTNFGEDAEAAAAFAIQNLIQDGVISGVRNSTMNLLKAGGDLNAQLEKALAFEQVFKDLAATSNPFQAALADMQTQFDKLKTVFDEAGATAEEYAQLQELLAKRQQEVVDRAMDAYRSTFFSDEENLARARQTIQSTLDPLGFGSIDSVDEFRALVEATDALANPELFGALMELVDEFGLLKDAAQQAADAAAAELEAREALAEEQRRQREAEIEDAKTTLRALYQAQRQELLSTAEQFREFGLSLREFRASLFAVEGSSNAYARSLAELQRVGGLASLGDADALGQLQGVSTSFLNEARNRAGSQADYLRDVARVAQYVDSAIAASDSMVTETERQIQILDQQVSELIDINEGVQTVAEAIQRLEELLASPIPSAPALEPSAPTSLPGTATIAEEVSVLQTTMTAVEESTLRQERAILRMESFWQRLSPDGLGLLVRADSDVPLTVVALP